MKAHSCSYINLKFVSEEDLYFYLKLIVLFPEESRYIL